MRWTKGNVTTEFSNIRNELARAFARIAKLEVSAACDHKVWRGVGFENWKVASIQCEKCGITKLVSKTEWNEINLRQCEERLEEARKQAKSDAEAEK